MNSISTKSRYVRVDGWRGYMEPINAVGAVNDTGMWDDSPAPTNEVMRELAGYKRLLWRAGIRFRTMRGPSSNVFIAERIK